MPAPARPAATVMLLRDAAPSPEVLMVQRSVESEFLPDLYVFPGGRVDDADAELADRVVGRSPADLTRRADDVDARRAVALYAAAVRETFEEVGVLLVRRRGESELLAPEAAAKLQVHRLAVQRGDLPFRELIEREDLVLAADRLALHGRWITPEMVPKRFDTFFFSALAPTGQVATHDGIESTHHVWIRPEDALAQAAAGERQIILPTQGNLETTAGFAKAGDVLAASELRPVVPVLPTLEVRDGQRRIVIREDAGYPTTEAPVPEAARIVQKRD